MKNNVSNNNNASVSCTHCGYPILEMIEHESCGLNFCKKCVSMLLKNNVKCKECNESFEGKTKNVTNRLLELFDSEDPREENI